MSADTRLIRTVRQALRAAADPAKAPIMQAYMKSEMPYRGVQSTPLRQAMRPLFAAHSIETFEDWRDTVLTLWREARYREERYAATGFPRVFYLRYHGYRKFFPLWALARFRNLQGSDSPAVEFGM